MGPCLEWSRTVETSDNFGHSTGFTVVMHLGDKVGFGSAPWAIVQDLILFYGNKTITKAQNHTILFKKLDNFH